jgi:hypothetical protein
MILIAGRAMNDPKPLATCRDPNPETQSSDLARRLARYRLRLEAEGRSRSVEFIDRAIEREGKKPAADQ